MLNVLDRILRKADIFNNYILSVLQFLGIIFLCTGLMCDIYNIPSLTSGTALTIFNWKIACPFEELQVRIMEFLKRDLLILND